MASAENVGTFQLTSTTLTISADFGCRAISLLLISGTVTYTGSMPLGSLVSSAITLTSTPLNIVFDFPIDGFSIDASAGSVIVITGK